MLPGGVDRLSIIATIRGLGKTTPVLILSALASLDERVRGLRGGGDDYLTKPFAFSERLAPAWCWAMPIGTSRCMIIAWVC
jgi:two-component system OmpR family response regulator